MKWFTSDLHFGHTAVINYCKRPYESVDQMNETLIKNWNACVQDSDVVYILGDLSFLPYKEFAPIAVRLKGRKILVRGNHDKYSEGQYNKLGIEVYQEIVLPIAGRMCRLSHYPYALPWYKRFWAYKSELRFMNKRPPKVRSEVLLHGHTHMKYRYKDNRIHVGVDAWNYRPAAFNEIESILGRIPCQKKYLFGCFGS